MIVTTPVRTVRTYTQALNGTPAQVFPLLCPVREAEWIDGWDPIVVLSESGVAERDCVFMTEADPEDATWYVTRHEPENGLVEMIKITPEVTACRVTIQVEPRTGGSSATVTYIHTSLGPDGDDLVESFTEEFYAEFMRSWEGRLNHFLAHGTALAE